MSDKLWKAVDGSVIGVDLGKNTALFHVTDGRYDEPTHFKLTGEFGERYHQFWDGVTDYLGQFNHTMIRLLVYEEPPYVRNIKVYGELAGYEAVLIQYCECNGIPWAGVNNRTIKKVICGDGKADKTQMLATAKKLTGIDKLTQDEADAILCAFYGLKLLEAK